MTGPCHLPMLAVEDPIGHARRSVAWRTPMVIVALAMGAAACGGDAIDPRAVGAEPGRTVETLYDWPSSGKGPPEFTDVTEEWGLGELYRYR